MSTVRNVHVVSVHADECNIRRIQRNVQTDVILFYFCRICKRATLISINLWRFLSHKSIDIPNNFHIAIIHIQKALVVLTEQKSYYSSCNCPEQKFDTESRMHRHVSAVRSSARGTFRKFRTVVGR